MIILYQNNRLLFRHVNNEITNPSWVLSFRLNLNDLDFLTESMKQSSY